MTKNRTRIAVLLGVLCVITCAAFFPALDNGFTNCDDDRMVTNNPRITSLSPGNLVSFFTAPHEYLYHPLVLLSYAVEYHFFGLRPFPYHATNLALHLCNTALVFLLIYLLCRSAAVAFLTTLLFALHPLRVESVAWVTERKDVLSACFYLGALVSYLRRGVTGGRRFFYWLSLALYCLSLLSKPMAVTLPFVLILFDYWTGKTVDRKALLEKIPFFVLALIFAAVALLVHYPGGGKPLQAEPFTVWHRPLIGTYNIMFYLWKTFVPANLSCLYQFPPRLLASPTLYLMPPLCAVILLGAAIIYSRKYTRKAVFGALFFLITILPVLQILPIGGKSTPADRFMYIPAIGLSYCIAEFLCWVYRVKLKDSRGGRALLLTAASACVSALAVLSWQRCQVWKDSVSVWTNVLKQYPGSLVSFSNRGMGYLERGETDKAVTDFNEAIRIEPRYFIPYHARGNARMVQGRPELAIADYTSALERCPREQAAVCYYNRGNAYASLRDYDRAIADYSQAIMLKPQYAEAYHNRGSAWNGRGQPDRAITDYSQAIAIAPHYVQAYFNRGNVFAGRGEAARALAEYTRAISLDPGFLPAYLGRAEVYFHTGEYGKAWSDVLTIERHGYTVDPAFTEKLHKRAPKPPAQ